ncbi:MAG TPA: NERD domain-containing protein [Clostridia bacterium]
MTPEDVLLFLIIICTSGALIGALLGWSQTPSGKGIIGEFFVKVIIGKTKEGKQYVLNNYMVVDEGKSSQIDHIVIRKNGVFVIESKNYSGRIYGKENQLEWTQVLKYGKVKNKIYNPLKQNATHIYRIKKILDEKVQIKSLVVFVQNNTKFIEANNVIPLSSLKKIIKQEDNESLTLDQMQSIYKKLIDAKQNITITKEEHISNINHMKEALQEGICPRCGGQLMEKNGKYGAFLGCSNYPNCKFIKKL